MIITCDQCYARYKYDESRFEVVGPSGTTPVPGFYAFWFAWYATHADDPGTLERSPSR